MTQSHRIDWTHGGVAYEAILHLKVDGLDAVSLIAFQGEGGLANRPSSILLFAFHFIPAADLFIVEAPGVVRLVWKLRVSALQAFMDRWHYGAVRQPLCTFTVPLGPELHQRLKDAYKIPVQVLDKQGRSRDAVLHA
ncbi:MAG: hypothetical protein WC617_12160 [Rhodanobacter sp.]|jgi:hypothetical protein